MEFDSNDYVLITFKRLMEEKGFVINEIDEDGLISLSKGDFDTTISLDNLRKDYNKAEDDSIIQDFVNAVSEMDEDLPDWDTAKNGIFPSLYPSDFDFGDFIHYPITEEFNMIMVYDYGNRKAWISEEQLDVWKIDNKTILEAAYKNLDIVLESAELEVEDVEGKKLSFFSLEDETMKSVLLLSKQLSKKVEPELGWPIIAVVPVRNFIYMFAEDDFEFFAERIGDVVMDEYRNSGYPITTELLLINDEAISAVAKFEPLDEDEE